MSLEEVPVEAARSVPCRHGIHAGRVHGATCLRAKESWQALHLWGLTLVSTPPRQ